MGAPRNHSSLESPAAHLSSREPVTFLVHFLKTLSGWGAEAVRRDMGNHEAGAVERKGAVRLRKAERSQLSFLPHCLDDLVSADHRVRTVMAVVEKLDVSAFCEPILARAGRAGRDATDPQLLVGLWLYGCVRGIGSARELARRCEESLPFRWLCGGVSVNHRLLSDFPCRSRRCIGRAVYAGAGDPGGQEVGACEPHQPGWSADSCQRGKQQFSPRRTIAASVGASPAARVGVA